MWRLLLPRSFSVVNQTHNKAMLHRQQAGWTNFPWFVLCLYATLAQTAPLQICRK